MILEIDEDLRFILQAAERDRMHDSVAVALIDATRLTFVFRNRPPQAGCRGAGKGESGISGSGGTRGFLRFDNRRASLK